MVNGNPQKNLLTFKKVTGKRLQETQEEEKSSPREINWQFIF